MNNETYFIYEPNSIKYWSTMENLLFGASILLSWLYTHQLIKVTDFSDWPKKGTFLRLK